MAQGMKMIRRHLDIECCHCPGDPCKFQLARRFRRNRTAPQPALRLVQRVVWRPVPLGHSRPIAPTSLDFHGSESP
jgi:hypothetical protein